MYKYIDDRKIKEMEITIIEETIKEKLKDKKDFIYKAQAMFAMDKSFFR